MEFEEIKVHKNTNKQKKIELTVLANIRDQMSHEKDSCYNCSYLLEGINNNCSLFIKRIEEYERLPECLIFYKGK